MNLYELRIYKNIKYIYQTILFMCPLVERTGKLALAKY